MQAIDNALLRSMIDAGANSPVLWTIARWLTELGGWKWLCSLTAVVAVWLAMRGYFRRAVAFVAITLGVRPVMETLKWWTDRPRPQIVHHPVLVHSQSFPSGHATDSMTVYLSLALIVAPLLTRARWPVPAAILLSIAIGLSRPILGVHWPSDILAAWSLGLAWTLSTVWLFSGWIEGQPGRPGRPLSVRR